MANPIIRGFRELARFSGRDRRKQFWPYAGVVVALTYALMMVFGLAAMMPMMAEMTEYAAANPEHATVTAGPGSYSVSIDASAPDAPVPDMGPFMTVIGAAMLLAVALLAGAVSRRLHDSGRSAFWGLMPVPFILSAVLIMPSVVDGLMTTEEPDLGLFGLLFLNNILYLAALVTLIVLLCQGTKPGANRFGEEPA